MVEKLKSDGIEITTEWMPFELDPSAPLEGKDLFTVYPEEYIVNNIKYLNTIGKELGLEYNNLNGKFNTRRAHLAGYYAKENGKYDEYMKKVFEAYFADKLNIAIPEVLDNIAAGIGLDANKMNDAIDLGKYDDRLMADYSLANAYSITSVPTFIINGKTRISGIKPYNEFRKNFE